MLQEHSFQSREQQPEWVGDAVHLSYIPHDDEHNYTHVHVDGISSDTL